MATAGALEDQELMSEGKNLSLQRCSSLKGLPRRRKQRENDREHVAEKLQRRLSKFNQFNQNGVFGRDHYRDELVGRENADCVPARIHRGYNLGDKPGRVP